MNVELTAEISDIEREWKSDRWNGIARPYTAEEVCRLRGSIRIDHAFARLSAEKLWDMLHSEQHILAHCAPTGGRAVQMVRSGLRTIYFHGRRAVPDGVPPARIEHACDNVFPGMESEMIHAIGRALLRADQLNGAAADGKVDWLAPIIADVDSGAGHSMPIYESSSEMIEAGAAGLHFEDMVSVGRANAYVDWRALVPTSQFIGNLVAARLASDVMGVPTVLIAKTAARNATLLTSDIDERDARYATGERTELGHCWIRSSLETAIERALSLAPFADMVSFESSDPDIDEARHFSEAVLSEYPGKPLAYSCSAAPGWVEGMSKDDVTAFNERLSRMGYRLQIIAGNGFTSTNDIVSRQYGEFAQEGVPVGQETRKHLMNQEQHANLTIGGLNTSCSSYFDEVSRIISRAAPQFTFTL